ncbi:hypothetical protein AKO1_005846 [Acrasis kona]|uniref:Uncharacterized protein n=1 Tax=Acrasis kona TaxID=1008807 RepID=A0AAW2YJP8_9EUKA
MSRGKFNYTLNCPSILQKNQKHRMDFVFKNSTSRRIEAVKLYLHQVVTSKSVLGLDNITETFLIKKQNFKINVRDREIHIPIEWSVPYTVANSTVYGLPGERDKSTHKTIPCESKFSYIYQAPNYDQIIYSDRSGLLLSVCYRLIVKLKVPLAKDVIDMFNVYLYDGDVKTNAISPTKPPTLSSQGHHLL